MQLTLPRCALLLVALIVSCKESTPETAIRVVVDSDLAVGSELTTIRVRVLDAEDQKEQHRQDFPLTSRSSEQGRYTVPFAFRLAQRANDAVEFRLVVTGRGPLGEDGEEIDVAEQQAITSFRPRTTKRLDMFLARACLGKLCRDEEGDLTCNVASGKCERVEVREDLPDGGGDDDAGEEFGDAETQMDAGAEAREYALGEAGKPCASELEQTLACEGHASRRVLKCQKGTWEFLQTCAQTERCDSRVGTDQGTCASIPAACSAKQAGEACDGAERVTCDVDLVGTTQNPCPAHAQCADLREVSCECNSGYEADERRECVDTDECASANLCSAAYPCAQTDPPGYLCLGQFADWPMPDLVPGAKFAPSYDTRTIAGIVIDNVTGLMWQQTLPGTAGSSESWYEGCTGKRSVVGDLCTWAQAKRYCSDLALADETDWRLPSRIELESILDETKSNPSIDRTAFPDTPSENFWSSSPYVGYLIVQPFSPGDAWRVSFNGASSVDTSDGETYRVRCVSGGRKNAGTPESRYIVNIGDDLVTDTRTTLIWQRTVDATFRVRDAAQSYCAARGSGWRLPSFKELLTLVDPTQAVDDMHPAIDPVAFPNTRPGEYVSSSPSRPNSASGRMVDFVFGKTTVDGIEVNGDPLARLVRCVR